MFQALECWIVSDFKLADLCENEYNVGFIKESFESGTYIIKSEILQM